jgi:hypothetical protein
VYHRLKDGVALVVKTSRQWVEDEVHVGSDDGSARSGSSGTRAWRSGASKTATAGRARHTVEQSDGRASGVEKTTSIHRWTAAADKGDLRCHTWGGGHRQRTVTVMSPFAVSCVHGRATGAAG